MKSILNKGLNENLKVHFSEVTVQVKNPLVESPPPPSSILRMGGGNSSSYGGVAFEIVNRKEHISFSGLEKILSLRASIN